MADASVFLTEKQRVKRVTETADPRLSSVMAGWDFAVVCAGIVVAGGIFECFTNFTPTVPTHGGKLYQLEITLLPLSTFKYL